MEERIKQAFPRWDAKRGGHCQPPHLIRYADDLVVLHADLSIVQQCQQMLSEWLTQMGLTLHPSKTRITHTLHPQGETDGFDFLGFTVRQFSAGKYHTAHNAYGTPLGFKTLIQPSPTSIKRHQEKLKQIIKRHQAASSGNTVAIDSGAQPGDYRMVKLFLHGGQLSSLPRVGSLAISSVKRGNRSPFDADWLYWSTRMGRHPQIGQQVASLLKRQRGKCAHCQLFFKDRDLLEIDHIIPRAQGGKDEFTNLQLLHRHCHDVKSANDGR